MTSYAWMGGQRMDRGGVEFAYCSAKETPSCVQRGGDRSTCPGRVLVHSGPLIPNLTHEYPRMTRWTSSAASWSHGGIDGDVVRVIRLSTSHLQPSRVSPATVRWPRQAIRRKRYDSRKVVSPGAGETRLAPTLDTPRIDSALGILSCGQSVSLVLYMLHLVESDKALVGATIGEPGFPRGAR